MAASDFKKDGKTPRRILTRPLRGVFYTVPYAMYDRDLPTFILWRWQPTKAQIHKFKQVPFGGDNLCRCVLDIRETIKRNHLTAKGKRIVRSWK